MNEKIYKITLSDGSTIENLKMNGNNFVSSEAITEEIFSGKLSRVTINDGERDIIYEHMKLIQIAKYKDEYYFILAPMSESELRELKIRADIDYIAMMADVEL